MPCSRQSLVYYSEDKDTGGWSSYLDDCKTRDDCQRVNDTMNFSGHLSNIDKMHSKLN